MSIAARAMDQTEDMSPKGILRAAAKESRESAERCDDTARTYADRAEEARKAAAEARLRAQQYDQAADKL